MGDDQSDNDLAVRLLPFWVLWGGPIAIMLSLNFIRHWYYASPVLLAGAALTLLAGFGIVDFGRNGLMYVTWGTFALVMLTFLPEKLFGKYTDQN